MYYDASPHALMDSPLYKRHRFTRSATHTIMVSKVFAAAAAKKRAAARKRVLPNSMVDDASSPMTRVRRGASTFLQTIVTALDLPGGKDVARDPGVAHAAHAALQVCFPFPASAVPVAAGGISAAALLAKLNTGPSNAPLPGRPRHGGLYSPTSSDEEETSDEKVGKNPAHSKDPLAGRPRSSLLIDSESDSDFGGRLQLPQRPSAPARMAPDTEKDNISVLSYNQELLRKEDYIRRQCREITGGSGGGKGREEAGKGSGGGGGKEAESPSSPPKRGAECLGDYQNAGNARVKRVNTSQAQEAILYCSVCNKLEDSACPYCGPTQGSPGY